MKGVGKVILFSVLISATIVGTYVLVKHFREKKGDGKRPTGRDEDKTDAKFKEQYKSYANVKKSDLVPTVLWRVIAREGASKDYTDLLPLDGGTVGIAHYAGGGLANLYEEMNTERYFGKSQREMVDSYSNRCLPDEHRGGYNDTGWGCYSKAWWREGMYKFLNSSESKKIQDRAWGEKMKPVIEHVIDKGWTSPRELAIAMGVANSRGFGGFKSYATARNYNAEKVISDYASASDHTRRRKEAIDKVFPRR